MEHIFNYFVNHAVTLNKKHVPKAVTGSIKKLDRLQREKLKARLTEKAKGFDSIDRSDAIDWLETSVEIINENAFHFNRVFFSPGNEIKNEIKLLLNQAEESVNLCIFTITDNELSRRI